MPNTTFAEHPLHPQLVMLPLALLPTSLALDIAHMQSRQPSQADAAYYTLVGATMGGAAAAVAGAGDYLSIPAGSHSKRIANLHAGLNLGILALSAASVLLRRRDRTSPTAIVLSAVCNLVSLVSAWYGGHLVYDHGVRVKDVSPIADAPHLKLPGDEAIAAPLKRLPELVPAVGPGPAPGQAGDGRTMEPAYGEREGLPLGVS